MIDINEFPDSANLNLLKDYLEFLQECEHHQISVSDSRNIHRHHIIPRCIGGTDEDKNLIDLSYCDHAKAHVLLAKAYRDNLALSHAAYLMSSESLDDELRALHLENLRLTTIQRNKEYFFMYRGEKEEICVKRVDKEYYESLGYKEGMSPSHRKKLGDSHRGSHHSEETKLKQSKSNKYTHVGDVWINNGENQRMINPSELSYYENLGYCLGRLPFSESHRNNLSREFSETHRKNISKSAKKRRYKCMCKKCNSEFLGKSWNTSTCPECTGE